MPAIRPSQFSALKALDPLDEQEKHSENHDRKQDIKEIVHEALP
jgi:hypothetical protein